MFDTVIAVLVLATVALIPLLWAFLGMRIRSIMEVPKSFAWRATACVSLISAVILANLQLAGAGRFAGAPPMAWATMIWMVWTWVRMAHATKVHIQTKSVQEPPSGSASVG